jgi:hypothetical protein
MITAFSRNNQSINSSYTDSAIYSIQDRINPLGYIRTDDNSTMLYPTFYEDSAIFNMTTNPLNNSTQGNPLL